MNILFISHRVPFPANKGEKIRTFNQIRYLADLGNNISVIAPIEMPEEVHFSNQLSEFTNISSDFSLLSAKPIRLITGFLKNKALSVANFYNTQLQKKIDSAIAQKRFDAIICTSSAMAEYIYKCSTLRSLKNKPLLLMDFMDLDSDKWQQYGNTSSWPMKWIYQREARILSKYEQQITHDFDVSFFIADAEVELFKSQTSDTGKVLTMGNGMDTDLFTPAKINPENEAPVFLFTGVMDYKPNIDAVVWFVAQIWPVVLSKYPKARFVIAGMNPSSSVQELVKVSGIDVTGFVDDILPYYHQANYFVAPFRLARGVQNKVLQAFACGLPVISTSMGAEGIDCIENKSILIANTQAEFLLSIEKLEQDQQFREMIKDNALALIHDHYSWQGKLQVLDDVLNNRI